MGGVQPIGAFHEVGRVAGLSEAGIGVQCPNLRPGVNDPGHNPIRTGAGACEIFHNLPCPSPGET